MVDKILNMTPPTRFLCPSYSIKHSSRCCSERTADVITAPSQRFHWWAWARQVSPIKADNFLQKVAKEEVRKHHGDSRPSLALKIAGALGQDQREVSRSWELPPPDSQQGNEDHREENSANSLDVLGSRLFPEPPDKSWVRPAPSACEALSREPSQTFRNCSPHNCELIIRCCFKLLSLW